MSEGSATSYDELISLQHVQWCLTVEEASTSILLRIEDHSRYVSKHRTALYVRTHINDLDNHVLDRWMAATNTHPACTIHEDGMWLPMYIGTRKNLTSNVEPQRAEWERRRRRRKNEEEEEEEEKKKKKTTWLEQSHTSRVRLKWILHAKLTHYYYYYYEYWKALGVLQ